MSVPQDNQTMGLGIFNSNLATEEGSFDIHHVKSTPLSPMTVGYDSAPTILIEDEQSGTIQYAL